MAAETLYALDLGLAGLRSADAGGVDRGRWLMEISSDRVRQERQRRGWTQQQLAEIADLSLRTVQRVENQSAASNETISSLCAVLEVPREELLRQDLSAPAYQNAARRMRLLLSLAVAGGAVLGSGGMLLLSQLFGSG
ncbi:MAG: helix-turn-helix domain-containing protein [Wenzhouxiangella sp.]